MGQLIEALGNTLKKSTENVQLHSENPASKATCNTAESKMSMVQAKAKSVENPRTASILAESTDQQDVPSSAAKSSSPPRSPTEQSERSPNSLSGKVFFPRSANERNERRGAAPSLDVKLLDTNESIQSAEDDGPVGTTYYIFRWNFMHSAT